MTSLPIRGLKITDHTITVPVDHSEPYGEELTVFAREVADPDGGDRPYLLFLQGGPGHESPRPTLGNPPWLRRALKDYRVVFLDQRGTGLSSPVDARAIGDPAALAQRLIHFRADAIVADAELLREHLGVETWSLLGQSFGGFTSLCYLSRHANSLREVIFTGGLPPVGMAVDDIYRATYAAMAARSETFFRRFPDARARLTAAMYACDQGEVILPSGDRLSSRRLCTMGNLLGMGGGEEIHYLLERDPRSSAFAHDVSAMLPFDGRNPIYAVLHEACYADGGTTSWSADRVRPDDSLLTGEHLFRWHFEENSELAPYRETAEILAEIDWPRLYDADALANADVPCAASIYGDDPFVVRQFSEETAALLPRMRPWLTNEYQHNGLRSSSDKVLDRLINLVRDRTD